MADARIARLESAKALGEETRLLEFTTADGLPLGFVGGQYVIVNTGVPLPGGKVAKRAYSILSSDADQQRFQIAVRRIGAGPGSSFMHELPVGAELPFSGPWGKYQFQAGDAKAPLRTLVFATDTGITAALGLVRGRGFAARAARTRLIWFVESRDYFLPAPWVKSMLPAELGSLEVLIGPPVGHPQRVAAATQRLSVIGPGLPKLIYLSGDGAVLYPLAQMLMGAGVSEEKIRIECFFNNPQRRAP